MEKITPGRYIELGLVYSGGKLINSANNSTHVGLMSAVKYFAETQLHLTEVIAARLAIGVKHLPAAQGYSSSMVLSWLPGQDYPFIIELEIRNLTRSIAFT